MLTVLYQDTDEQDSHSSENFPKDSHEVEGKVLLSWIFGSLSDLHGKGPDEGDDPNKASEPY